MTPSDSIRILRPASRKRPAILAAAVLTVVSVAVVSGPAARTDSGVASLDSTAARSTGTAPTVSRYGQQSVNGYNWSGVLIPRGSFSSVSSSWTEPRVSCTHHRDLMAPWVGIDGSSNNAVEQTGVETSCSGGKAHYRAWYEVFPAPAVYYRNSVQAGDMITATVTRQGSRYTMKLTDHTQHWTRTTVRTHHTSHSSAEVVLESPNESYPKFGTVTFTKTTINGHALTHYSLQRMHASSRHGYETYTSRAAGGHFTVRYHRE